MLKRRDKSEIFQEIIVLIDGGEHIPTRLCRGANITYSLFRGYVKNLIDKGLIMTVKAQRKDKRAVYDYELTDRGKEIVVRLRNSEDVRRLLE